LFQVYEKKKAIRWRYDLGRKKNFEQVRPGGHAIWNFSFYFDLTQKMRKS
jgi:hypothetical protein